MKRDYTRSSYGFQDTRRAGLQRELALENSMNRLPADKRGADPYNTGAFDPRNNWARIGKR